MSGTLKHIMLDVETFGTKPGAAVVTLAAVYVSIGEAPGAGRSTEPDLVQKVRYLSRPWVEFYATIDLRSCVAAGLHIDADTLLWWLKQSEAARAELLQNGMPLREALQEFEKWLPPGPLRIWGNGASFDAPIVAEAFERCGLRRPWDGRDQLCYRTIAAAHRDVPRPPAELAHHALYDARAQARHLEEIVKQKGLTL